MASMKQLFLSVAVLSTAFTLADVDAEQVDAGGLAGPTMTRLTEGYPYLIVDQALPDALREFGHNLGIAVEISEKIKGRVRRYDHAGSSGDFLRYLASKHNLDWMFDRGRLVVSSADEKIARSWPSSAGAFETTKAALAASEIDDPRYPLGFDPDRSELSLSAPPRYMSLAAPVIERVLAPKATRTVNVIHGRARAGGS